MSPVIDHASTRPEIDSSRPALLGVSDGGYFAAHAAAFDQRLAALIVVDGLYNLCEAAHHAGAAACPRMAGATRHAPGTGTRCLCRAAEECSTGARWALNHGPWSFGVSRAREFVARLRSYTLKGVAEHIRCPALVCEAEHDQLFRGQPEKFFEALSTEKTDARFTVTDAAEEHCHAGATQPMNQRVFDWLDDVLQLRAYARTALGLRETRARALEMS